MIKFDWKRLVKALQESGFNVEYQAITDGNIVVDDEVAIYDKTNEVQLFYITDNEVSTLYNNNLLKDYEGEYNLDLLKDEVVKVIPNIEFNI